MAAKPKTPSIATAKAVKTRQKAATKKKVNQNKKGIRTAPNVAEWRAFGGSPFGAFCSADCILDGDALTVIIGALKAVNRSIPPPHLQHRVRRRFAQPVVLRRQCQGFVCVHSR